MRDERGGCVCGGEEGRRRGKRYVCVRAGHQEWRNSPLCVVFTLPLAPTFLLKPFLPLQLPSVMMFLSHGFSGLAQPLHVGDYDVSDLISNDMASSFRVPQGLKVDFFADSGWVRYLGSCREDCELDGSKDKAVSSLRVETLLPILRSVNMAQFIRDGSANHDGEGGESSPSSTSSSSSSSSSHEKNVHASGTWIKALDAFHGCLQAMDMLPGSKIQVKKCDPPPHPSEYQAWTFTPCGQIRLAQSTLLLCMDTGGTVTRGVHPYLQNCDCNNENQIFIVRGWWCCMGKEG